MWYEYLIFILACFSVFLLLAKVFINIGIKMAVRGAQKPIMTLPKKKEKPKENEWENYHGSTERVTK